MLRRRHGCRPSSHVPRPFVYRSPAVARRRSNWCDRRVFVQTYNSQRQWRLREKQTHIHRTTRHDTDSWVGQVTYGEMRGMDRRKTRTCTRDERQQYSMPGAPYGLRINERIVVNRWTPSECAGSVDTWWNTKLVWHFVANQSNLRRPSAIAACEMYFALPPEKKARTAIQLQSDGQLFTKAWSL